MRRRDLRRRSSVSIGVNNVMASIEKIKKLRDSTQASITDCKKALEKSEGDLEKAKESLQKMGLKVAQEKGEREAKEGVVGVYVHPDQKTAGMIKVFCETDFVARTDDFKDLAHELALQVAGLDPENEEDLLEKPLIKDEKKTTEELIKSTISTLGENIELGEFERFEI